MQASKGRRDLLMNKIRLERVTDVLKLDRKILYEVEQQMINDGHLQPLQTTPDKKKIILMLKNGDGDEEDKPDPRASDSEGELDDRKEFARNINKWSDISFSLWSRNLRRT